jgi:hypothetical protein
VKPACSDHVLADHLHNSIGKQSSSLSNRDPAAYNYIKNAPSMVASAGETYRDLAWTQLAQNFGVYNIV